MRSSTSSSDIYLVRREVPAGAWLLPFVIGLILLGLAIASLEGTLAIKGFKPTVVDSPGLWSQERRRADELGDKAVILIGASRAQLDVDLGVLSRKTGRVPLQLAIDGNSFVPVLADLADDPSVTGTIVVEYQDNVLAWDVQSAGAAAYLRDWHDARRHVPRLDFSASENMFAEWRQEAMRSYADGAGPFVALMARVVAPHATPQYLVTLPSREKEADYSRISLPAFYYERAKRNAGITDAPDGLGFAVLDKVLSDRIRRLPQASTSRFDENIRAVATMVRTIEARGGRVVFVMFPRSGLVREADDTRFPRQVFWDRFLAVTGAKGVHFADVPALSDYVCPDGSHLDIRDRARFTSALTDAITAKGGW